VYVRPFVATLVPFPDAVSLQASCTDSRGDDVDERPASGTHPNPIQFSTRSVLIKMILCHSKPIGYYLANPITIHAKLSGVAA
jgi:hypothetical protein